MSRGTRIALTAFGGLLLFAIIFSTGFAAATVIHRNHWSADSTDSSLDLFREAWDLIERDYYGDLPAQAQISYGAIRGSLSTLDDPYSILVEPQPHRMEQDRLRGSFGGIGAYVSQDEQGLFILDPISEDQPSAKAGILSGDVLLAVDGSPVSSEMTVEDVVLLIRGPIGEIVTLTVRHPGEDDPADIDIVRATIELPSVMSSILDEDPSIGYILLTRFTDRSAAEVEASIQDLRASGADKLVLDLRSNPGGLLQAAIDVADLFLDGGEVMIQLQSGGQETVLKATRGGVATDMPLVILINGASASASEIVGGALQDRGRAILIGQVTFGKGSVQNIYDLSDGSSLHITAARWFTPNRNQIDGKGLSPDIMVEPGEGDSDLQLEQAVEHLETSR